MKKIITVISLQVLLFFYFSAQDNLVLNPSFEEIDGKLKKIGQINVAKNWISPTALRADLFSSDKEGPIGVPVNDFGKEFAKDGKNYAGVVAYSYNNNKPRTYIQSQLDEPLISGVDYCVKFSLSLSDLSKYAIDKIGIHVGSDAVSLDRKGDIIFSERSGDFSNVIIGLGNKVYSNRYNWETVCGVFKSEGKEKFITIGNFYNGKDTKAEKLKKLPNFSGIQFPLAYYYIDNVEVKQIKEDTDCDCFNSVKTKESIVYQSSFVDNTNSLTIEEKLNRSSIYFDVENDKLEDSFLEIIENVVEVLNENENIKLQITGHIDQSEKEAIKSDPENDKLINLGQYRANKVKDYLVENGVDSERLTASDIGADNPASKGMSKLSLAKNRRVVFTLIK
jgi:outer membrane protein OmpA-like peptidoglycan-associated protein